jgi:hypothetical protein
MQIDVYTRLMLTIIAACLLVLAARSGPWVERAAAQPAISCQGQLKANAHGGTAANLALSLRRRTDLGRGGRFVAACLGGVWLSAGLAAIVAGLWFQHAVLPVLVGLLALGYGWVWSRVAITGERQQWPLRLRRRSE